MDPQQGKLVESVAKLLAPLDNLLFIPNSAASRPARCAGALRAVRN